MPLLEKILERPSIPMSQTSICNICGCLMLPTDPSCPNCRVWIVRDQARKRLAWLGT